MPFIEINSDKKACACVVYPDISGRNIELSPDARLEEACGLALAINLEVVHREIIKVREIKPGMFFSRGILDKLRPSLSGAELLIVDASLTPIQQRNLEKELNLKVIDRTALVQNF